MNQFKKPPTNLTLDWLAFHSSIFKEKDQNCDSTFKFIQRYAGEYNPMMFEQLSNIVYGRAPELNEIEEMFNPQTSLFEDTKENHVALFSFIFDPLEFNIEKLRDLENHPSNITAELLQPLIETYL